MTTTTPRKKTTHYMRLVSAKSKVCAGKGSAEAVRKAASAYVANAIAKAKKAAKPGTAIAAAAKAKKAATTKASAIAKRSCRIVKSVGVGKTTKRRVTTKRK